MPQVIVGRPFHELELPYEYGFQPAAFRHLCRRESLSPSAASRLRQIGEWTLRGLQTAEVGEEFLARTRSKSVPGPRHVDQSIAFVISEDQGIEVLRARRIPADHKLLPLVDPHLLPSTRALAGFVSTVLAFRDNPFQTLRLHGCDQIIESGVELRREAYRVGDIRDRALQECAP